MKKLSEYQIQDMIGRKEKIKFIFMIAAFVAMVVNVFYFYKLYKLDGEETLLLKSIVIFNIVLSFGIYALIVGYSRNNVTDVSYFLWYMDSFLSIDGFWKYGEEPFMFVKQWRMYSSFRELSDDVKRLKYYYSKQLYWVNVSLVVLLLFLVCNGVEVLFCGESARIFTLWTSEVAFYLFLIPKFIFSLILVFSLFMFLYYKDKIRSFMNNQTKGKTMLTGVSKSVLMFTSNLYKVASFLIGIKKLNIVGDSAFGNIGVGLF